MKQCIIHDGEAFRVTSYGNGLSYELLHKAGGRFVCFQGEDASQFQDEWEAWADMPGTDYETACQNVWLDYACVSQACEVTK